MSAAKWLETHHRAKRRERQAFCQRLVLLEPRSVLDVGCATGLWLEELHAVLPSDVRFVGVDTDEEALDEARARATSWDRDVDFVCSDINEAVGRESADLTLLFNMSGYLADIEGCLEHLAARGSAVAIRQYDGDTLRFGPMDPDHRAMIDDALRASVKASNAFRHYDMDRVIEAAASAGFERKHFGFELFQRVSPFPTEFLEYLEGTLDWTAAHMSDQAGSLLEAWRERSSAAYFTEVDFIAVLS